jgi:hypothetical protein
MRVDFSSRFLPSVTAFVVLLSIFARGETFNNPQLIQTTYDPETVATGDVNGDGIPDIVYTDGTGPYALHVLLGNGNGTFTHKTDIDLPTKIGPLINLADVTNDGVLDIIVGGPGTSAGEIAVYAGKGDGSFQSPVISTISHNGSNGGTSSFNLVMAVGDVNGDGDADLIAADATSATLYVLLGNNTGKFSIGSTITEYFTGHANSYLYDLNGDGNLDIVVNDLAGGESYVFLGKGGGQFDPGVYYQSRAVLFTDLDNDGHPDLVGMSATVVGQVDILKGNADGTFGSPTPIATVSPSASLVEASDYNGDGVLDLLFIDPAGVGVALGLGNLTYGPLTSSVGGGAPIGFYADLFSSADFRGKGYSDVTEAVDGGLLILQNNGDGTFGSGAFFDVGESVGSATVADFNGDNVPDIAVTVSATYPRILLGSGTGTFTLAPDQNQSYGTAPPSSSILSADFSGDKMNDVDMLGPSSYDYLFGQPLILFGNGNATLQSPQTIATGPALVGDVNNDGRADLISFSNGAILALLGESNHTFNQVSTLLVYPSGGVAALGDLNHDGKLDLLVYESPSLRVWFGNGDGTFTSGNLVTTTNFLNQKLVLIDDLDGDGKGDIILVPYPNQEGGSPTPLTIFYGNGDGTFQNAALLPISHAYTQLVIGDVNRDGKPDLVLSDGAGIAVIENLGNRVFGNEQHYVAGEQISGLNLIDVNGDGYPDIIVANANGTTVAVLLNDPTANPVDGAASNGVVTVSPEPASYGQAVTFSITVSSSSGPVPTGSVTFGVDGASIATVTLSNGKASYAYNGVLNTGSHMVVATYNGDATYAPENFSFLHTVQSPVYATTTKLVATPTVVYTSQTVSLTATVSSSVTVPSGLVTFYDGSNTLGVQQIYSNPLLLVDTNLLTAGTHHLTAVYSGYQDPFDQQATYQPSTSISVTVTVNAMTTSITLSPSATTATAGTIVTFTASVSASSGGPFGGVTFYDGSVPLGTSSLADGSCTYSTAALSTGTHSVTAVYNANATFASSTSPASKITINGPDSAWTPTAVALGLSGGGRQSVLTANLAAGNGIPVGTISFLDNGNILGSSTSDDSGTATLIIPSLAVGVHNLYASFAGSAHFAPSVSPVLTEELPAAGGSFLVTESRQMIDLTSATEQGIVLGVAPTAGFEGTVHLSCSAGIPEGYSCSFSPESLASGNSSLWLQPRVKSEGRRERNALYATAFGIFCFALITYVRRTSLAPFAAMSLLWVCLLLTGCGTHYLSPKPAQMTVLSIRATSGSAASLIVKSVQIVVTF